MTITPDNMTLKSVWTSVVPADGTDLTGLCHRLLREGLAAGWDNGHAMRDAVVGLLRAASLKLDDDVADGVAVIKDPADGGYWLVYWAHTNASTEWMDPADAPEDARDRFALCTTAADLSDDDRKAVSAIVANSDIA